MGPLKRKRLIVCMNEVRNKRIVKIIKKFFAHNFYLSNNLLTSKKLFRHPRF